MSLTLLTSPEAVRQAIAEFDALGREAFLEKYGYGPSDHYFLRLDGRLYDSKAIAGVAVGYEHPERGPLRPNEFSGGDRTVRGKLHSLGFPVVFVRSGQGVAPRTWWVNQGTTYTHERQGGYIWAPLRAGDGRVVHHHVAVAEVSTGDVIFHYARGLLRAVGVATGDANEAPKPAELGGEWERDGYLAPVAYHDAPSPIALEEIPAEWRTPAAGPFTRHGAVQQGYLFPLSEQFVTELRDHFGSRWPELISLTSELEPVDAFDEFVAWGGRIFGWSGFEDDERTYKIEIADKLAKTREALLGGGDWMPLLEAAMRPPNNLLPWQVVDRLKRWFVTEEQTTAEALRRLWGDGDLASRFRSFLELLPAEVVTGQGTRTAVVAHFLLAEDPLKMPMYRPTPFDKAYSLVGYSTGSPTGEWEVYERALSFLDRLLKRCQAAGLETRDRLDAQGIVFALTKLRANDPPIAEWSQEDREAFLRWRGDSIDPRPQDGLEELAQSLLLDVDYLSEIEHLIRDKGQVIFYGPPGTGKTYVARQLAWFLAGRPDRVKLVQFHPSYAYEDFVEGFRPQEVAGQPGFGLVPGPFREIAEAARQAPDELHVLIIDEINRGNVAKVFGELYFLLEYREEQIRLQYSAEEFELPDNLWLIGTMNTADRSIALLDAALRRRFYFVPFFPDEPPVAGLLRRWLDQNKPEFVWLADVVDRANARLGDRNVGIGPSYFMRANLSAEWVERIWTHAIVPYLAEQFFGQEDRLADFSLDRLKAGESEESLGEGVEEAESAPEESPPEGSPPDEVP